MEALTCICSRYWRRSMDEGSVMDPKRSSAMPSPLLPVLPVLSLRCSTCQSPAQDKRLSQ